MLTLDANVGTDQHTGLSIPYTFDLKFLVLEK